MKGLVSTIDIRGHVLVTAVLRTLSIKEITLAP
jgi:hypothetical protein